MKPCNHCRSTQLGTRILTRGVVTQWACGTWMSDSGFHCQSLICKLREAEAKIVTLEQEVAELRSRQLKWSPSAL